MRSTLRAFTTTPKGMTEEMVEKIIKRDEELRRDYYDMPSTFPESSQPPNGHVSMVCSCFVLLGLGRRSSEATSSSLSPTRYARSGFASRQVGEAERIRNLDFFPTLDQSSQQTRARSIRGSSE